MSPEDASKALKSLGTRASEVARSLSQMGHRGHTDDPEGCPLAVFLEKSGADSPHVSQFEVVLGYGKEPSEWQIIRTPVGCALFLVEFDARLFPELIENESVLRSA